MLKIDYRYRIYLIFLFCIWFCYSFSGCSHDARVRSTRKLILNTELERTKIEMMNVNTLSEIAQEFATKVDNNTKADETKQTTSCISKYVEAIQQQKFTIQSTFGSNNNIVACIEALKGVKIENNVGKSLGIISIIKSIYNIPKITDSEALAWARKIKSSGVSVVNDVSSIDISHESKSGSNEIFETKCPGFIGAIQDSPRGLAVNCSQYVAYRGILYEVTASGTESDDKGMMKLVTEDRAKLEEYKIINSNIKPKGS